MRQYRRLSDFSQKSSTVNFLLLTAVVVVVCSRLGGAGNDGGGRKIRELGTLPQHLTATTSRSSTLHRRHGLRGAPQSNRPSLGRLQTPRDRNRDRPQPYGRRTIQRSLALPNRTARESCLDGRGRLCGGNRTFPCKENYTGEICVGIFCSCLKYGSCEKKYSPVDGYICPCLGDLTGFNCTTVDRPPKCDKHLQELSVPEVSNNGHRMACYSTNSSQGGSPCTDIDDTLMYFIESPEEQKFFFMKPEEDSFCLYFRGADGESTYSVTVVAREEDDAYARRERYDTFPVRAFVRYTADNRAPVFPKNDFAFFFDLTKDSSVNSLRFQLNATDPDYRSAGTLHYRILNLHPVFYWKLFSINELTGEVTVQRPAFSNETVRQFVTFLVQAKDNGIPALEVMANVTVSFIFAAPLCNLTKPIRLYSIAFYNDPIGSLYCFEPGNLQSPNFVIKENYSGLNLSIVNSDIFLSSSSKMLLKVGNHNISVGVSDARGWMGEISVPVSILPSPEVTIRAENSTTVNLSWNFRTLDPIARYLLGIINADTEVKSFNVSRDVTNKTISALKPDTIYTFQLNAMLEGKSPASIYLTSFRTPENVSAVCSPEIPPLSPANDRECLTLILNCDNHLVNDQSDLKYHFGGNFTQAFHLNSCVSENCVFCYMRDSDGFYKLDITVSNGHADAIYHLPVDYYVPQPPICESENNVFHVDEYISINSKVARVTARSPKGSGSMEVKIIGSTLHNWNEYFKLSHLTISSASESMFDLVGKRVEIDVQVLNTAGQCTSKIVIFVDDENDAPVCYLPSFVKLQHPLKKNNEVIVLNCSDPDVEHANKKLVFALGPVDRTAPVFDVTQTGIIYLLRDLPSAITWYNLTLKVADSALVPARRSYPLAIFVQDIVMKNLTTSFRMLMMPWDEDLLNKTSDKYKKLKADVETNVSNVFSSVKGYLGIEILRFRPGSIMTDTLLSFLESSNMTIAKEIYKEAIKSGIMGEFTVDPSYLFVDTKAVHTTMEDLSRISSCEHEGCNVTYCCCAMTPSPFPLLNFSWSINKTLLEPDESASERIIFHRGCSSCPGQQECVTFDPLLKKYTGVLTCAISGFHILPDSKIIQIKVLEKPLVTLEPSIQNVHPGHAVNLTCSMIDESKNNRKHLPAFRWYDGAEIIDTNDNSFIITNISANSQQLTILNLGYSGTFSCEVYNSDVVWSKKIASVHLVQPVSTMCSAYIDNQGVQWPATPPGVMVNVSCSQNYTGSITRMCANDSRWEIPDYHLCTKMSVWDILSQLKDIKKRKDTTKAVLKRLSKIIGFDENLNVKKLQGGTQALGEVVKIQKLSKVAVYTEEVEHFYHTASNLLSPKYKDEWSVLHRQDQGIFSLMKIMGDYGDTIVKQLVNASLEPIFQMENVVVQMGRSKPKDIVFPNTNNSKYHYPQWMKSNVLIPGKTLASFLKDTETVGFTAIYYRDVASILSAQEGFIRADSEKLEEINTNVLSMSITNNVLKKLDPPVRLTFYHLQSDFSEPICSFWNFSLDGGTGDWSSLGCMDSFTNETMTVCECNHLTNFALLMSPSRASEKDSQILGYITIAGCSISILGCVLTIASYFGLWRYVRQHRAVILINLCLVLIIADVLFLAGVKQTSNTIVCTTIAALLHYFYMVVFFTMLAEGVDMAISVTYVFATKSRTHWLLPMAWGIPAVIVAISLGVTKLKGYGNDKFCWLSLQDGLIWAFVAPALIIITMNFVVITVVFRAMCSTNAMLRKSAEEKAKSGLHGACVLLPVLGLTWVFGVFSVNEKMIVFQYLFAIFNSIQGILIFVFHCILNKKICEAFWKKTHHLSRASNTSTRSSPRYPSQDTVVRTQSLKPKEKLDKSTKKKALRRTVSDKLIHQLGKEICCDRKIAAKRTSSSSSDVLTSKQMPSKSPGRTGILRSSNMQASGRWLENNNYSEAYLGNGYMPHNVRPERRNVKFQDMTLGHY